MISLGPINRAQFALDKLKDLLDNMPLPGIDILIEFVDSYTILQSAIDELRQEKESER